MKVDPFRAFMSVRILHEMEKLLNQLEKYDPYGDLVDNFETIEGVRQTQRLIKYIEQDFPDESWPKHPWPDPGD